MANNDFYKVIAPFFPSGTNLAIEEGIEWAISPTDIQTTESEQPNETPYTPGEQTSEQPPSSIERQGSDVEALSLENQKLREQIAKLESERSTKKGKKMRTIYSPEWSYFVQVLRIEGNSLRLSEMSEHPLSDCFLPLLAVSHVFDRISVWELARTVARLEKKHGAQYLIDKSPETVIYGEDGRTRKFSAVAKSTRGAWITVNGLLRLLEHFAKKNVTDDESERVPLRYDGTDMDTSANRLRLKSVVGKSPRKPKKLPSTK